MKLRVMIFILAFALSIGLCVYSNGYVEKTMSVIVEKADEMEDMLKRDDTKNAFSTAESLKEFIDQRSLVLESLVPHEDLHDLTVQIEDIALTIRIHDLDDCQKALALIKENADHLISHEAFAFGNIF